MPTPVAAARQCLTDEAARALDDAVAVARRRSHAQTTSLHAVSALLALPSSTLRDACARARNSPCSSRLQFRALELCVGVSLDRLPSSKTLDEPPISNSLMAAIKRSQANQRRHPDNFHLQQIHCNQQLPSVLKVELKYFILSILDDPIVSRVLGEAGFRSCDIKLAILHPPVTPHTSRFSRTRYPPMFLPNMTASGTIGSGLSFPFGGREAEEESFRRINEALMKRNGKGKNLLLLGACAADALNKYIECVNTEKGKDLLPNDISGLKVISIEKEISEFVNEGGRGREKICFKFEELKNELEQRLGPGILLSLGELKGFVCENDSMVDALSFLVSKLTGLLEDFRDELWLVGAAAGYETYSKFLGQFPNIEKDWDLHIVPITSSKSPIECFGSKSGLMGSFVPFGGFFSTPADFKDTSKNVNHPITQCHLCTAKYEQEVADTLKIGTTISVADQHRETLPSWLQMAQLDTGSGLDAGKTKTDGTTLNEKISGLQRKWNDICQRLHHAQPFSKFDIYQGRLPVPNVEGIADRKDSSSSCSSRDSSLNESQCANLSLGVHTDVQNVFPSKHSIPLSISSKTCQPMLIQEAPKSWKKYKDDPSFNPFTEPSMNHHADCTSSLHVTSVTTDLGLGTLYASGSQITNKSNLSDSDEQFQHFTSLSSSGFGVSEIANKIVPSGSNPPLVGHLDSRDYKSIRKALLVKVGWQEEAISSISQAICHCKAGYGRHRGSIAKGDIWLTFLGPDKIGKRRIASILAEIMFGCHENLISVDLSLHDGVCPSDTVFECQELNDYDAKFRGKTVADYIAKELSKKPHSVVLLENVDKADLLVQTSLSQAVRTSRFPYSVGEISINNVMFVTTTTVKDDINFLSQKDHIKFSEESILGAKSWQMQILIEHLPEGASTSNEMSVRVSRRVASTASSINKRKRDRATGSAIQEFNYEPTKQANKVSGSSLDLNLPVEEVELEENVDSGICDSDPISENSEAWLEDFFDQVDKKVQFKPFDFDALAEKISSKINVQFQKVFGPKISLEIDEQVMLQIVAASWLSETNRAVEDWVEMVLGRGFTDACQKCQLAAPYVVKLETCKGVLLEERAPGICLPARINL